jgi:hypothetical protein
VATQVNPFQAQPWPAPIPVVGGAAAGATTAGGIGMLGAELIVFGIGAAGNAPELLARVLGASSCLMSCFSFMAP